MSYGDQQNSFNWDRIADNFVRSTLIYYEYLKLVALFLLENHRSKFQKLVNVLNTFSQKYFAVDISNAWNVERS